MSWDDFRPSLEPPLLLNSQQQEQEAVIDKKKLLAGITKLLELSVFGLIFVVLGAGYYGYHTSVSTRTTASNDTKLTIKVSDNYLIESDQTLTITQAKSRCFFRLVSEDKQEVIDAHTANVELTGDNDDFQLVSDDQNPPIVLSKDQSWLTNNSCQSKTEITLVGTAPFTITHTPQQSHALAISNGVLVGLFSGVGGFVLIVMIYGVCLKILST